MVSMPGEVKKIEQNCRGVSAPHRAGDLDLNSLYYLSNCRGVSAPHRAGDLDL